MTSLLTKLGRAEEAARQQCAELSRQMEELQERLAVAQRRLERLSIAREELTALEADDEPADAGLDEVADADHGGAGHVAPGTAGQAEVPQERPVLRGLRKDAVVLLASSDKPLRARDVVRALGQQDVRGQVEGMRARLKRLVDDGWLAGRAGAGPVHDRGRSERVRRRRERRHELSTACRSGGRVKKWCRRVAARRHRVA
ncbi:hypothetical protein E1286_10440 [Nonomuraea terrae]|uniref:Uncharacterized protein n=1 Tax=Nonomuraea terrae TaxID=2530383 RepID=A0A4R4Z1F6_9ACTN|nr:hypothetical protein [Nonomuraea terrae]TDD51586.1 hypothetical protein E1286_10440 [Nonomuraea terrae]